MVQLRPGVPAWEYWRLHAKQHLRGRIVRHRRTNLLLNGRLCVREVALSAERRAVRDGAGHDDDSGGGHHHPAFHHFNKLNMLDTLTPLWIIEWLAQPFGIFLMRQAFMNIPKEYEEAAKMEGRNPFQIYLRIFIPMARPTLATLAIFTFMGKWNEILTPVIYLTSNEKYTRPSAFSPCQASGPAMNSL